MSLFVSLPLGIVILFYSIYTISLQLCKASILAPALAYIAEVCFNVLVLFYMLQADNAHLPHSPSWIIQEIALSLPNHCSIIESTHDSTPLSPGYPSATSHTQSAHLPSHKFPSSPSLSYTASLHLSSLGCPLFLMLRRRRVGIGTFYFPLH